MAYCDRCSRSFPHYRALEQHKEDSGFHWPCDDCDIDFVNFNAREQHYINSRNHHFCVECGLDFYNEDILWEHLETEHHACQQCCTIFDTYEELQEHDREVHVYCTECRRSFQNQNNLRQHLSSKLHQPNTVLCPGRGCNRSFTSPARLVLHFESGACRSGMTRDELNRLVVRADRNNVITNPARLLGGWDGYEPPASAKVWATDLSWNGEAYECFLCNSTFRTLESLNQHLQSPRHESKIYRCPKLDCDIQFVALSALCQHVEAGSCGVRMFRPVRDAMESLTRGFNAITI
ncbi:hypothetical protein BJV78DRAFT_1276310 [Lactifluus subvellereus]|nr:hypothetical protein BJV78DRAFT_1276310 [Lactifluus subvellereus]